MSFFTRSQKEWGSCLLSGAFIILVLAPVGMLLGMALDWLVEFLKLNGVLFP